MLSMKIIGWSIVVIVGVMMFVNAVFMLASPSAWFRLPRWLRAQGTLTEDAFGRGWGAVTVRLAGAVVLAVMAWVVYSSLNRR